MERVSPGRIIEVAWSLSLAHREQIKILTFYTRSQSMCWFGRASCVETKQTPLPAILHHSDTSVPHLKPAYSGN